MEPAFDESAQDVPNHPGALRELASAFWPHRDTYLGKCALLRIFKMNAVNRQVRRGL